MSMIIVEQNSDRAAAFRDRAYIVRTGNVVLEPSEREWSDVAPSPRTCERCRA